jgi:hypothetical protein
VNSAVGQDQCIQANCTNKPRGQIATSLRMDCVMSLGISPRLLSSRRFALLSAFDQSMCEQFAFKAERPTLKDPKHPKNTFPLSDKCNEALDSTQALSLSLLT